MFELKEHVNFELYTGLYLLNFNGCDRVLSEIWRNWDKDLYLVLKEFSLEPTYDYVRWVAPPTVTSVEHWGWKCDYTHISIKGWKPALLEAGVQTSEMVRQ